MCVLVIEKNSYDVGDHHQRRLPNGKKFSANNLKTFLQRSHIKFPGSFQCVFIILDPNSINQSK